MAKPAEIDFLGGTPLTQETAPPPGGHDEAFRAAEVEAGIAAELANQTAETPGDDDEDVTFEVPDLPRRGARRRKSDFYIPTVDADKIDALCRYAKYHFDVNKGEVQELVVRYGLRNLAEVMRALRKMAEGE